MPANTSPSNIQYPISTDNVAPLETVFANMANSIQTALDGLVAQNPTAWTTYTPSLTNMSQGNGTLIAKHRKNGASRDVVFQFILGSTSTVGSVPYFSLPTTAPYQTSYGALYLDDGTATIPGIIWGRNDRAYLMTTSGGFVGSTSPFTWVAGDAINTSFTYAED